MATGIRCPDCGGDTKVLWTRDQDDSIHRQRVCKVCGCKAPTRERFINRAQRAENVPKRVLVDALRQVIAEAGLSASDLFPAA